MLLIALSIDEGWLSHPFLFIKNFYGNTRIFIGANTAITARFDLAMEQEEKEIISRAAFFKGSTIAVFMRMADAKEKAYELLDKESRLTMTERDFETFTAALNASFTPNPALQNALGAALQVKRA